MFIKKGELKDGVVIVRYYSSFEEYKKDNPKSKVHAADFNSYWTGNNKTQKRLETNFVKGFADSLRLVRLYPEVKKVDMEIPVDGKTYKFLASREQIEKFFNVDLDALYQAYQQGETSLSKYIDPIIYNDSERDKFLKQFITEQ